MSLNPELDQRESILLREFLAGRDVECPQCRYNLRDLTGNRCPECGDEVVIRLNMAEPKLAMWIAGLVGLASGAGFSGLLLVYIVIQLLIRPNFGPMDELWKFIGITFAGFAIEGTAVYFWIRKMRWIRRLSLSLRRKLVIGCWMLSLSNVVLFAAGIR